MSVNKERDLKFIKEFSKISLTNICKELNVDKSNIYRGISSPDKIKIVKEEIQKKLEELKRLE